MKKTNKRLASKNNFQIKGINALKKQLSRCTLIAGKIHLAKRILELGGSHDDLLEAEIKAVQKTVGEQRKSTYELLLKLYKNIAYDDRKELLLNILRKGYNQFFNNNYSKVLTFFHAPSDMCRLFYLLNCNTYPYQYFKLVKIVVGRLSFIDFAFLISLIDYKNCECHNYSYYDFFNEAKIDNFWDYKNKNCKNRH